MVLWIAFNRANDSNSSAIFFLRPSIDKEKGAPIPVKKSHWPRFRDAFTMAAINSRRNRRALHAESRDADSAFVAKETFTTRGKSTLYISGGGEVRDKEPPPWRQNCARIFPAGERERERDRSRSAVRKKGSRSFVKTGDVDDLKIERESR